MSLSIIGLMLLTVNVKASVNISDEDYARLRLVFSDVRISFMSDEEIQRYLSYDLENTNTAHKYYKVTENINGSFTYSEVDEEEAMSAIESGITPYGSYKETSYKHIQLMRSGAGTNKYYMNLYTEWLITPKIKSYDVSALRVDDATVVEGSQSGTQTYWDKNTKEYNYVDYSANGKNIVKKSNGFGISMNLVDSGSYFACEISALVVATTKYAHVYGSYQHAAGNVTLAQSQSYNISHNGLGGVINFSSDVEGYYDRMGGVDLELAYSA